MKPWLKGLIIGVVQVGLVVSLGAKLLYDRATYPRVWTLTLPYDPNLPIRGRYVQLQVVVEPKNFSAETGRETGRRPVPVTLHVDKERLVARAILEHYDDGALRVIFRGPEKRPVLAEPLAFFIPEHVPDPSRRSPGQELWVEVTVPPIGPPRPIRLGVKENDGPIVPLALD